MTPSPSSQRERLTLLPRHAAQPRATASVPKEEELVHRLEPITEGAEIMDKDDK
jgi:hypothetical protein